MKGVILAGGKGLRLFPLTKVTNKHLLPVGREPMIMNPIRKLKEAGITEIMIISSIEHTGDILNLLGSGAEIGCDFSYKVQETAGGIAHALALAENFANKDKIVVILGDNLTTSSLKTHIDEFRKQEKGAKVLLKRVGNPTRFGVAAIDEHQVIEIEEKPEEPKSNFAVVGYYMYDGQVFDIIRTIKPSKRGELEITSVNNAYIQKGQLTYSFLDGDWIDAGTFESLAYANQLFFESEKVVGEDLTKVTNEQLEEMIKEAERRIKELKKLQSL